MSKIDGSFNGSKMKKVERWLENPQEYIISVVEDEDIISVVVKGDTEERIVGFNKHIEGYICSCPYNKIENGICSHIIFVYVWLKNTGRLKW